MVANYIYHYTSIDVLMALFDGIQDDEDTKKKCFVFHGSSIFSMNDTTEFIHGFNMIWDELPNIEKNLNIRDERFKISKFWNNIKTEKKVEELNKEIIDAIYDSPYAPFVICFSRKRDALPLWSMYGDNGHGVCLKFCESVVDINMRDGIPDVKIYNKIHGIEVEYGQWETESILLKTLNNLYSEYYKETNGISSNEEIINCQLKYLALMCVTIAPYVKNNAYAFEEETRLKCDNPKEICYIQNKYGQLTSFALMKIPTAYLSEIIVGPALDFKATERILKHMRKRYGLEHVDISVSQVPYRD